MSNRRKLKRPVARDPYPDCNHVRDDEDLSLCRWPGCQRRWVLDITQKNGYAAFTCEEHGIPLIEELADAGELKSVTGMEFDPDLMGEVYGASREQSGGT